MQRHEIEPYASDKTQLMTTIAVAQRLAVSPATVKRLSRNGELRRVAVGGSVRFQAADVEALIERGKRDDGSPSPVGPQPETQSRTQE